MHPHIRTRRTPTSALLLLSLAVLPALAACGDDPPPLPSSPAADAAEPRQDPARIGAPVGPSSEFGWVGLEHNRAMSALLQEARQRPRGASADVGCDAALGSARRYVRGAHVRTGDGRALQPADAALDGYLQLAARIAGCGSASGRSAARSAPDGIWPWETSNWPTLAESDEMAQAIVPGAPTLSDDARRLLQEMHAVVAGATSSADVAAGFAAVDRRAASLAPTERTIVMAGTALGRASAEFAFDSLRLSGRTRRTGVASAADSWMEGGGDNVIEADISGCIAGAIVGSIGGGAVGALSGCALGGIGASLAEMVKEIFW